MLKLLLMFVGTYLGIMFCVATVSMIYRGFGAFGFILLAAGVVIMCWIGSSTPGGGSDGKK